HLERSGGEHAERDAEIVRPGEIEEPEQVEMIALAHQPERTRDEPLDPLVDPEDRRRDREADQAVAREETGHAGASMPATTCSQREQSAPSSVTSGRWRQQRSHLWRSVF